MSSWPQMIRSDWCCGDSQLRQLQWSCQQEKRVNQSERWRDGRWRGWTLGRWMEGSLSTETLNAVCLRRRGWSDNPSKRCVRVFIPRPVTETLIGKGSLQMWPSEGSGCEVLLNHRGGPESSGRCPHRKYARGRPRRRGEALGPGAEAAAMWPRPRTLEPPEAGRGKGWLSPGPLGRARCRCHPELRLGASRTDRGRVSMV